MSSQFATSLMNGIYRGIVSLLNHDLGATELLDHPGIRGQVGRDALDCEAGLSGGGYFGLWGKLAAIMRRCGTQAGQVTQFGEASANAASAA